MSTADKLNKLLETKQAIKQAIIDKGVEVADDTKFADYPSKISSIPMEGGNPYYEDLYNMRTSNGTNMTGLFYHCKAPELDLRNLDTSKVTSMQYMFEYCSSSVNVDGWDTSNVTTMSYMFDHFTGSVDISKLNTSSVTSVNSVFYYTNTDNIILTGLSFPKCTKLESMFSNASGTTLDLSSWDISNITNMNSMFSNAKIKKIDLTGWKTTNVTNMGSMFSNYSNPLEELIIPDWDMTNCSNNIFGNSSYIKKLKLIDLSRSNDATITKIASYLPTRTATTSGTVLVPANTSQEVCDTLAAKYWTAQKPEPPVEDIPLYVPGEFQDNTEITEVRTMVNYSHDDLSNMFAYCSNLVSVNTEDWDTSNVTNMTSMFDNCPKLTQLDVSNWNTSNVTEMFSMFYGCASLTQLNLSNFDTSSLSMMCSMFSDCTSLTTLDLSNWDTSCVFDSQWEMSDMFDNCTSLHTLRLDNCSNDTISKIINSEGFPTGSISGVTRTIYCKESEAAGLTAPTNWTFSYVD